MLVYLQLKPLHHILALVLIRHVYPGGLNIVGHRETSRCLGTKCRMIAVVLEAETKRCCGWFDATDADSISLSYRYATSDVKRNEDATVRERIADAVLDNGGRNFWADI